MLRVARRRAHARVASETTLENGTGDVTTRTNHLEFRYSKDYTLAVVPLDVAYDADLRAVFSVLREAGRRLHTESNDVTGDTQIEGITAFGPAAMTIRTTTRVKPGHHDAAAAELRLAIKEAFDRTAEGAGRKALVPSGFTARSALNPRERRDQASGVADQGTLLVPPEWISRP